MYPCACACARYLAHAAPTRHLCKCARAERLHSGSFMSRRSGILQSAEGAISAGREGYGSLCQKITSPTPEYMREKQLCAVCCCAVCSLPVLYRSWLLWKVLLGIAFCGCSAVALCGYCAVPGGVLWTTRSCIVWLLRTRRIHSDVLGIDWYAVACHGEGAMAVPACISCALPPCRITRVVQCVLQAHTICV